MISNPATLSSGMLLAERASISKRGDALIIIAQCLAQYLPGVLAQQRRRRRIDSRREAHIERRFDIGNHPCSRMRNLAKTMPLTCFGCVESLLDGSQITNRNVGFLHLCHPILELVAGKDPGDDGA